METVLSHHTSPERQPTAVPELPNDQPHQLPKQRHAEDRSEQIEATAEKINTEEQAGFKAGRSTTEQIFNLRILCEKYLRHQQDLYYVVKDLEKKKKGL